MDLTFILDVCIAFRAVIVRIFQNQVQLKEKLKHARCIMNNLVDIIHV